MSPERRYGLLDSLVSKYSLTFMELFQDPVFQEGVENFEVSERGLSADHQTRPGFILGLGYLDHHTESEDEIEAHV